MKNYELLTIFKPSLDSEELDKVVDKISEEVKSNKGSVSSVDKMGRKKYRGSMDKVYRQYIAERLAGKAVVADHAFITHSGEVPEETLSQLTALVRELAPFEEVFVTQAGCTVSSHCGPGTLGVLFLRKA